MTRGPAERVADLELARRAALLAGCEALAAFGRDMEVWHKSPGQPVTPADLAANEALRAALAGARPEYGWLSEESEDDPDRAARERVWIVDPIDGTRSYVAGRPEYAVSVGLAEAGEVVVGVVYSPSGAELFHAIRGRGAWLERLEPGEKGIAAALRLAPESGARTPLHVSAGATERPTLLASRSEMRRGEFAAFEDWHLQGCGSTALKLAGVAAGRADAFFSRGPKSEWDVAAGALLVEEAGGRASELSGASIGYNKAAPDVRGVVATNGALHERLLERIRAAGAAGAAGAAPEPGSRAAGAAREPESRAGGEREDE